MVDRIKHRSHVAARSRRGRWRGDLVILAVCGALLGGCAARTPVVSSPAFPSYPFPMIPAAEVGTPDAAAHVQAWAFLQADDLAAAEAGFGEILRGNPRFYPAAAGLGFVGLARGSADDAVARFDLALANSPTYVPALLGRGEALLLNGHLDQAIESFTAAVAADPGLTTLRQRIAELRYTGLMDQVARARAASEAGRDAEAQAAYERVIAASPESGFLYLELAAVERRLGDTAAALGRLERAVELDPNAVTAWMWMSEIYMANGDLERAEQALLRADAIEPGAEIAARLADLETRRRQSGLPPEYQEISMASAITRGQLAALIGVQFESLLSDQTVARTAIVTDARDHWAYGWVITVAQAGVMLADANYRFEPERLVTRADLAQVAVRVLRLASVAPPSPALARPEFSDLGPGHLSYPSASEAVAAGLLGRSRGAFQPNRSVGGTEATTTLGRLAALVGAAR